VSIEILFHDSLPNIANFQSFVVATTKIFAGIRTESQISNCLKMLASILGILEELTLGIISVTYWMFDIFVLIQNFGLKELYCSSLVSCDQKISPPIHPHSVDAQVMHLLKGSVGLNFSEAVKIVVEIDRHYGSLRGSNCYFFIMLHELQVKLVVFNLQSYNGKRFSLHI